MPVLRQLAHLVAGVAAMASAAAQQRIVVEGGRNALQLAIGAAGDGATLIVRAGTYDAVLMLGRALTIRCDPGVYIDCSGSRRFGNLSTRPDQTFALTGATFVGAPFDGATVAFGNCRGPVALEGVRMLEGYCWTDASTAVQLRRCDIAELRVGVEYPDPSNVVLSDCIVRGDARYPGRASIRVGRGELAIASSLLFGPPAGSATSTTGPVLQLDGGRVRVTGHTIVSLPGPFQPTAAITSTGGELTLDPTTMFLTPAGRDHEGSAVVRRTPVAWSRARGTRVGETLTLELSATPGLTAAAFVSPAGPPNRLLGELLWVVAGTPPLFAGIVPATGSLTASARVPAEALGAVLTLQALSIDGGGLPGFGVPSTFVIE
ncbi:MAG: hypothetical protein IPM29_26105 [Planctomycetes bacterium]|nr:hypothetical protein [Planctomycetota bacterium]